MRALRVLVPLALAAALLFFLALKAGPAFRHPIAAYRLIRADAPSSLPVPVTGVKPRQLTNSWGFPRSGGRSHEGIDIFAPRGRPVISTTRGLVVTVGENRLGGKVVRILGPGGQWHYYAHFDRFSDVRAGELVEAGRVIGFVGTSGNARGTPPHLHYGIYRFRGGALNPYPLLSQSS